MSAEVDVPFPNAYLAYQLKMAGVDLREIAHRCDYPSPNAAALAIRKQMHEAAAAQPQEERETILQLELDRLNYMLSRIWPQIEHGDLKSVETALKIINTRTKLMGLDSVDASTHTQTVLVVGGEERDYVQRLKQAAGEIDA